jgi:hypothetical protein
MNDSYPASDPIPDPNLVDGQYSELVTFLTNSREMRNTAKSSIQQSLYAGSGALAGGFIMGPIGGLLGGIAGSLVGFFKTDNYDGALLAICKLEERHKQVLLKSVGAVLMTAGATAQQFESVEAFKESLVELASHPNVRRELWNVCRQAVEEE